MTSYPKQAPEPIKRVGAWRADFSGDEWTEWVFGATAGQLRAFNAWGAQVLAATEPVGFPTGSEVLPPAPELSPEQRRRREEVRARRVALSREEKKRESRSRGGAMTSRRARVEGYVPSSDELRRMRRSLGFSQRTAAAAIGLSRGVLSEVERPMSLYPRTSTRARVWKAYCDVARSEGAA